MAESQKFTLCVVALVAATLINGCLASIDTEPVKVTHRNSGPKYDIEDNDDFVDRTKLTRTNDDEPSRPPMSQEQGPREPIPDMVGPLSRLFGFPNPQEPQQQGGDSDASPIGHISIRRIYLVPVESSPHSHRDQPPTSGMWSPPMRSMFGAGEREQEPSSSQETPNAPASGSLFPGSVNPFFPFFHPPIRDEPTPAVRPPSHHHLFGADQASRSPTATSEDESPSESALEQQRPTLSAAVDPYEMMVDLIRQAFNGQSPMSPMRPATSPFAGLVPDNKQGQSKNETKEEIVEIDGKKFLRKTVINRHVGENHVFMTKRLIFVPLNETDSASTTQAPRSMDETTTLGSPTAAPESTTTTEKVVTTIGSLPSAPSTSSEELTPSSSKSDEATTTTTVSTTTGIAREEETTTTTVAPQREETTTSSGGVAPAKESAMERLTELVKKVESMIPSTSDSSSTTTTTTPKPDQQ